MFTVNKVSEVNVLHGLNSTSVNKFGAVSATLYSIIRNNTISKIHINNNLAVYGLKYKTG